MFPLGAVVLTLAGVLGLSGCDGGDEEPAARPCPEPVTVEVDAGYRGGLIDAWAEMGTTGVPGALACGLDAHEVEHAALAVPMNPADTLTTESAYRAAVEGREARFLPFMDLPALGPDADDDVQRVVREVGLFWRGVAVEDLAAVPDRLLFDAASRDFFVAGPVPSDLGALAATLGAHSGTKVLALVGRPVKGLEALVRDHERLFVVALRPARSDVENWLPILHAAPGRVMWGSGASSPADVTTESYARVVNDVRRFIAQLPAPIQDDFAAATARRLLGVPERPQPEA